MKTGPGGGGVLLEFKKVFMEYYDRILRQLACMLHDPYLAEDLAQEVFIRLYEHPLKNEEYLGAWLYRVAKNVALNRIRSDRSRMLREARVWEMDGLPVYTPFQQNEEVMHVREVLNAMDERDRTILIMKHSDYSYDEIAKVLKVKKTSVGTLVARAQRKFKELYGEV
ncbi:sigma-70 family RNA polymerase sigma factor [Thermoanaerobacterium sp. DL9XJH110]|uniref:sigma-70 family RNA polymerase sigma factor n=1 Tax=Thermoanaerobacterium sp. DL9XJH110 TaxID=3386643 RepID=UPI003BB80CF9